MKVDIMYTPICFSFHLDSPYNLLLKCALCSESQARRVLRVLLEWNLNCFLSLWAAGPSSGIFITFWVRSVFQECGLVTCVFKVLSVVLTLFIWVLSIGADNQPVLYYIYVKLVRKMAVVKSNQNVKRHIRAMIVGTHKHLISCSLQPCCFEAGLRTSS